MSGAQPTVAVVTHLYPSESAPNAGTFVADQASAVSRAGVHVHVVPVRFDSTLEASQQIDPALLADTHPVHLPRVLSGGGLLKMAAMLPFYISRARRTLASLLPAVDVVHAHFGYPDGVAAVLAARKLDMPVVVTLHGSDVNRQLKRPVVGPIAAQVIGRASAIVVVSEPMLRQVETLVPHGQAKRVLIPNGYDSHLFSFDSSARREQEFLFVGSLVEVKNPVLLVDAFADIADQCLHTLTLVGDGPLRQVIEERIRERAVGDRVTLAGAVSHADLPGFFRRASALVLPSRTEGMPIVVNESLACGTPVVASAVGGIPSLVASDDLGLLVPAGDRIALGEALLSAASKPWDNERIATTSPIIDWNENAARLIEVYRGVVVPHGRE